MTVNRADIVTALADKAQVALTALKRLESQSGLEVFESTRDQVRRALEAAGIVFLSTDKGEGVLLQHDTVNTDKR